MTAIFALIVTLSGPPATTYTTEVTLPGGEVRVVTTEVYSARGREGLRRHAYRVRQVLRAVHTGY